MKTRLFALLSAAFIAVAAVKADPIVLNSGVSPQPSNSGQGTIEAWILGAVTTYNVANNPDLPSPGDEIFRVDQGDVQAGYPSFDADTLSILLPTDDYDFIALHWGGPGGGVYQAYYIGYLGAGSSFSFIAPSKYGLSWYDVFSPRSSAVPEGASSLALLGLGVFALLGARRLLRC